MILNKGDIVTYKKRKNLFTEKGRRVTTRHYKEKKIQVFKERWGWYRLSPRPSLPVAIPSPSPRPWPHPPRADLYQCPSLQD